MSRKIYFDYGDGYEEVTQFVRNDLTITERMATDDYHYAQNVANFTLLVGDEPDVPDDSTGVYYYKDSWSDEDGWMQTLAEDIFPTTRGGAYKRDFITISGGSSYTVRFKATSTSFSNIVLVAEKADNDFEIVAISSLPGGNGLTTFTFTPAVNYTGIGFIWDSDSNLELEWIYIGTGNWVSNLDKLKECPNALVKILDDETQIFQGKISNLPSFEYDGIYNNIQIPIECTDSLLDLDVQFDEDGADFVMRNCYVMNPDDEDNSLIHQLCVLAGKTIADFIDDTVTIMSLTSGIATLSGYSNNFSSNSILSQIDLLMYEHGYVPHMNEYDKLSAIKWLDTSATAEGSITEDDAIISVSTEFTENEFEGVKVKYYEIGDATDVLLYMEDLPRGSDGLFSGYYVPYDYYYPIEANDPDAPAIYQEYTENGIKTITNEAIVKKLDFDTRTALSAFTSDYSSIIATSGHYLEASYSGLTLVSGNFYNRKAQLLWKNEDTTASGRYIYYANIRGDVLYRKAEKSTIVTTVSGTKKINTYESSFISSSSDADIFAQGLMASYDYGKIYYSLSSETKYDLGSFLQISMGKAIDQLVIVLERTYDENTDIYNYKCKGYSTDYAVVSRRYMTKPSFTQEIKTVSAGLDKYSISFLADFDGSNPVLTDNTITASVYVDGNNDTVNWTFAVTSTSGLTGSLTANIYTITDLSSDSGYVALSASKTGYRSLILRCDVTRIRQVTPEIIYEIVPARTPSYLGRITYSGLASTDGLEKDRILTYATASGECGIWQTISGSWAKQYPPTTEMISEAWPDIIWGANNDYPNTGTSQEKIQAYTGPGLTYFEMLGANIAFFNSLFAQDITMASGGIIKSVNYAETGGYPTAGYELVSSGGLLKAKGARLRDVDIGGDNSVAYFGNGHVKLDDTGMTSASWDQRTSEQILGDLSIHFDDDSVVFTIAEDNIDPWNGYFAGGIGRVKDSGIDAYLRPSVTTTANTTNGSSTIVVASATGINQGMFVKANGIPTTARVFSISGTSIVLTEVATATQTGVTTYFGYYGFGLIGTENIGAGGYSFYTSWLIGDFYPWYKHNSFPYNQWLGRPDYRWGNIYTDDIDASGSINSYKIDDDGTPLATKSTTSNTTFTVYKPISCVLDAQGENATAALYLRYNSSSYAILSTGGAVMLNPGNYKLMKTNGDAAYLYCVGVYGSADGSTIWS